MQKNNGSLFFNMTDEEIFSDTENALRLFSYEDFGNIVKYEKQKFPNQMSRFMIQKMTLLQASL